ncbi:MAG: pilus assembly protein PilZ [Chloroflexota bacterium]|nr:MAG: pilus assembly protein PilZ [Chloroflexota bacterium]
MKIDVKRILRDETGAALAMALILLLIGGLMTAPLLSYMGGGLIAGEVYEARTAELYAVDAGIEDAVWKIQNKDGYLPCSPGSPARNYTVTDINGKNVDITITSVALYQGITNLTGTYRVESTTTGNGSRTQIEAYIEGVNIYGDYGEIVGNVLTSQEEIVLKPGTEVNPSDGEHSPVEYYEDDWPTAEELIRFYLEEVEDEESYDSDLLTLDSDMELGPFYRDGELEIKAGTADVTLTLTGTVYVSGDTLIGSTGQDFTLDLNNHTIFVASNSSDPQKALWIGGKCTIVGSGVIITVGDFYFEPNTEAGVTDPIFVMSVFGTTSVQPGGDFYGSIAGSVEIELQPGTSINYPESEGWVDGLNFLIGVKKLAYIIDSWEISQQ